MSLFANRSFLRLWTAGVISTLGSQISRIALILYLFDMERSAGLLALLVVLETLPGAIAAPLAGAVVDRRGKRGVMVLADLVRLTVLLSLCFQPSITGVCLAAALLSIAGSFFQPAKLAAVPKTVEKRQIPEANGLIQSSGNLALILGPIAGAELFLQLGLTTTLLLDAASYLLSALLIAGLRERPGPKSAVRGAWAQAGIREGWSYLNRNPFIVQVVALIFVSLLCTGLWLPLAPFFIEEVLGGSRHLVGWQVGMTGLGATIGALWAPSWMRRFGKGPTLSGALILEGAVMALYSQIQEPGASMALMVVWGLTVSGIMVPFHSILQTNVAEHFQGRVFAVVKQSENIALVAAMGVAMVVREAIPAQVVFLIAGVTYFALASAGCLTPGGRLLMATR